MRRIAELKGRAARSTTGVRTHPLETLASLMRPRVSVRGSVRSSFRHCCETFGRVGQRRLPKCGNNLGGNAQRTRHALNADTIREMHLAFRRDGRTEPAPEAWQRRAVARAHGRCS